MKYKNIIMAVMLMAATATATAQQNYSTWGSSHPSPETNCGEYQWPEVSSPCPEVQIKQKHDHTPQPQYRRGVRPWSNNPLDKGWDTVVDCNNRQLILSCMPYIPVQYFNGYYAVDEIPFDPADTSFYLNYVPNGNNPNRWKVPINNDDDYNDTYTNLGFNFFFFGNLRTSFCVGDNGIVTFMPQSLTGISSSSNYCPFSIPQNATLPWNTTNNHTPSGSEYFNRMHEAIYGVYEDTYTGSSGSYMSGNQGIYYGVIDEEPCLKGIATWNEIPIYNNSSVRETFQMVCYQGSNIIEVHVKHRYGGTSTSYGQGFIGIQNADGLPQTAGPIGSSTMNVIPNAPAAFWPENPPSIPSRNCFTDQVHFKSYRFTPQGSTQKQYEWFRILDTRHNDTLPNGNVVSVFDTVHLRNVITDPSAADDTNGFFYPMVESSSCPTLTRASVSPTCISRYVFHLKFQDATNYWYDLYDTIVIGVDTSNILTIRANDSTADARVLNICAGTTASLSLEYPVSQVADTTIYRVFRHSGGEDIELPLEECTNIGDLNEGSSNYSQSVSLLSNLPTTGLQPNKIDSVYLQASINFTSGCQNYTTLLVNTFPNFVIDIDTGICQGESFLWSANNKIYTTSTHATEVLKSTPNCDSTVNLHLTVYDKSYTIDRINDCKPYTWINDTTYYASNNATALSDTILLHNRFGCDSVVQLEFTLSPVIAHIQSDRDFFDFDHLEVTLTDVSENNDSRTWIFPGGFTTTGPVAYYTIPAEYDEADIWLKARSPYGCVDSTHIVIPMRKESFWVPNIFTPESAHGNNTFGSISTRTLTEEMHIYNRFGQLVFHCDTPDCQWDGRDANGNLCPQGTYTYIIRYTNEYLPKVVHVLRGTVTLIR